MPTVLLIEDNAETARLVSGALRAAPERFDVRVATTAHAG